MIPWFDRPWRVALAVFLAAFSLYGLTTSQHPQGYEDETSAVTEGFVRTGEFVILPDSPMRLAPNASGGNGVDGKVIGRAGLPDPLFKAPFYAAGWAVDEWRSAGDDYVWRQRALWFSLPLAAALAAACIFLAVARARGSMAWGVVVAGLFTAASLAWPYAKAGCETVLMLAGVLTFTALLYAHYGGSWKAWALAGFGAGMVLAGKPYGVFAVAAMLPLLIAPLRAADAVTRRRLVLIFCAPVVLWLVAFAAYNLSRTGSITETGRSEPGVTLAAPFNFIGFLMSPGKGLIWYSPLVVIGLLGLRPLWRERRDVALAIALAMAASIATVSVLPFWSDEMWGPRYIVWTAWLLLLPIPWWIGTSMRRQRILAGVAALAVAVQLLPVLTPPPALVEATRDLTTQPVFQRRPPKPLVTPYGRDPIRWIPELSPLLFQMKLLVSYSAQKLGAPPITTRYGPYEGPVSEVTLDRKTLDRYGFGGLYVWWIQPGAGAFRLVALPLALLTLASWALLVAVARGNRGSPVRAAA